MEELQRCWRLVVTVDGNACKGSGGFLSILALGCGCVRLAEETEVALRFFGHGKAGHCEWLSKTGW